MALLVSETVTTREGITTGEIYVRIEPKLCICGSKLDVEYSHYVSKTAYTNGASTCLKNEKIRVDYDRATEGSDILSIAHTKLTDYLTTSQGTDSDGNPLPPNYSPENVSNVDLV